MKAFDQIIELVGYIYSSGSAIIKKKNKKYFLSYPYTPDFTEEIPDNDIENMYYVEENVLFRNNESLIRYLKVLYINDKYQNNKIGLFDSIEKSKLIEKADVEHDTTYLEENELNAIRKLVEKRLLNQKKRFAAEDVLTILKETTNNKKSQNLLEHTFEYPGLLPGQGVTIGNALRRVLLTSLEGYAIVAVYISGIENEFSRIPGVHEDFYEIKLNLEKVRLRMKTQVPLFENITIKIENTEVFTAGMIENWFSAFEIINPELQICTLSKSATFELEITVGKGAGYLPSESDRFMRNKIGYFSMNAIFTPVTSAKFSIENMIANTRLDYEKLILKVETDGRVLPREAIMQASELLIDNLLGFREASDTELTPTLDVSKSVDKKINNLREKLKTPIEDLNFSVRAFSCLKAAKIKNLYDLVQYEKEELVKFRNFGMKSINEVEKILNDYGLTLGMDITFKM